MRVVFHGRPEKWDVGEKTSAEQTGYGKVEGKMKERQKLLDVLAEVREDVDFDGETALVEDGLIDSLDLTQIIAALDDAFDVHIEPGDIEPENFNSAEAMLALVNRYRNQE